MFVNKRERYCCQAWSITRRIHFISWAGLMDFLYVAVALPRKASPVSSLCYRSNVSWNQNMNYCTSVSKTGKEYVGFSLFLLPLARVHSPLFPQRYSDVFIFEKEMWYDYIPLGELQVGIPKIQINLTQRTLFFLLILKHWNSGKTFLLMAQQSLGINLIVSIEIHNYTITLCVDPKVVSLFECKSTRIICQRTARRADRIMKNPWRRFERASVNPLQR